MLPNSTLGWVERTLRGELGRRLVHASGSGLPVLYLLGASWELVAGLYVICAISAVALDLVRLYVGLDLWLYEHLTREYEQEKIAGYVLYLLSSAVVWFVFAPDIAVPAILMLTLGDPVSGTIGSGDLRFLKEPKAMAMMFITCATIAAPFHYTAPVVVGLGAVSGTLADGVKLSVGGYIIDDNLTIPLLAGTGMQLGVILGP
jgi:dolichol kinase